MIKDFFASVVSRIKRIKLPCRVFVLMNPYTGHMIKANKINDFVGRVDAKELRQYEPIPEELIGAAKKKLARKEEAQVSLTSGGKLSRWASRMRVKRK
jgi:hypothetical protein